MRRHSPSQPATSAPAPIAPEVVETVSPEALEEARQVRSRYGIRNDEVWIREVAANPAAEIGLAEFGIPLMPAEYAELLGRRNDPDVLRQIKLYGARHPDSFAGAYIDQRVSMGFIVSFKDDADRHREALTNLLPEGVILDVRDVEWSTRDLEAFIDAFEPDHAWFDSIGARFREARRRITEDHMYVYYQGSEEAGRLIEEHYGNPSWLVAERQGPLPWEGARGDLIIEVVDPDGRPLPNVECEPISEEPEAPFDSALPFGTGDDGLCVIENIPAVAYRVVLRVLVDNDHYEPFRELHIEVTPHGAATRVVVDPQSIP